MESKDAAAAAAAESKYPVTHLSLPNQEERGKFAIILDNVFSDKECQELIDLSERYGYELAMINVGSGRQKVITDARNNGRCVLDSPFLAHRIWHRIRDYIPAQHGAYTAVGLNERLRFLKYNPGEYFAPHFDGTFVRHSGQEMSILTLQLYLNGGFQGGDTTFLSYHDESKNRVACKPKTGRILIFEHDLYHEGSELLSGKKYCIRTDVMYRYSRIQSAHEYPEPENNDDMEHVTFLKKDIGSDHTAF